MVAGPGERRGETELWFGFDDETRYRFRFSDRVRPDAAAAITALKARGLTVEILSFESGFDRIIEPYIANLASEIARFNDELEDVVNKLQSRMECEFAAAA